MVKVCCLGASSCTWWTWPRAIWQHCWSLETGCHIYKLGTGSEFSVLQVIEAFQKASGRDILYQVRWSS